MDWQPIETAPKDGTYIIIGRAGENMSSQPVEITCWFVTQSVRYDPVPGSDPDLYRRVEYVFHEGWNGNGHRATHWMPLPSIPQSS